MPSREQFQVLTSGRANTYEFLSRIYGAELDAELMRRMKSITFEIDSGPHDIREGYRLWTEYLASSAEDSLSALAVDYARIFIGTAKKSETSAYPYESVYTSETGLMKQEAWDDICDLYRREGFARNCTLPEPEDHIAAEFQYLSFLCRKSLQAQDRGDTSGTVECLIKQKDFQYSHLLNWIPDLCSDILGTANEDFYKGLALITRGFLELDTQCVSDLILSFSEENGFPAPSVRNILAK